MHFFVPQAIANSIPLGPLFLIVTATADALKVSKTENTKGGDLLALHMGEKTNMHQ